MNSVYESQKLISEIEQECRGVVDAALNARNIKVQAVQEQCQHFYVDDHYGSKECVGCKHCVDRYRK